jgi:hypothetical protein
VPSFQFASGTYQPGLNEFGPIVLSNAIGQLKLEFSRDNWPENGTDGEGHRLPCVSLRTWVSTDGGDTWREQAGFEAMGGDAYDRDGELQVDPVTAVWWKLPPAVDAVARRFKMEINVLGDAMQFTGTGSWQ